MDPSAEDAGLERLLAQLLRTVNPASAAGTGRPLLTEQEDTPRAGDPFPAVSASEARALIELLAARGIAQGQLAVLLGLEKSTMSRLAAGLERKGWIRRGRDEGNQRYVRLYLTGEGRVLAHRVWRAWHTRQARILATLSAEERAGLAAGLRGLLRGLAAEGILAGTPAAAAVAPAGGRRAAGAEAGGGQAQGGTAPVAHEPRAVSGRAGR